MPGGQPSTTQPSAGPWLSPQVVTRKRWPNVLCDMSDARTSDPPSIGVFPWGQIRPRPEIVLTRMRQADAFNGLIPTFAHSGVLSVPRLSGRQSAWRPAFFGMRRTPVQAGLPTGIGLPRPTAFVIPLRVGKRTSRAAGATTGIVPSPPDFSAPRMPASARSIQSWLSAIPLHFSIRPCLA